MVPFNLYDACSHSKAPKDLGVAHLEGVEALEQLAFRFSSSSWRPHNLVHCMISTSTSTSHARKFAETRLKQASEQGVHLKADLPDGGSIYVEELRSNGKLACLRTPSAAEAHAYSQAHQTAPTHAHAPHQTTQPSQMGVTAHPQTHAPRAQPQPQYQHQPHGDRQAQMQIDPAESRFRAQQHPHQVQQQHPHQVQQQYQQQHPHQMQQHHASAQLHQQQRVGVVAPLQGGMRPAEQGGVSGDNAGGEAFLGRNVRARGNETLSEAQTCGTICKRTINVGTNFYPIRVDTSLEVSQYEVSFDPPITKAETRRRVLNEVPVKLLARGETAYDGNVIIYVANGELQLTPHATEAGWASVDEGSFVFTAPPAPPAGPHQAQQGDGRRRYKGALTLKPTGKVGANALSFGSFLRGAGGDLMRAQMMVLDVVFRAQSAARCKCLGDAFYDETAERAWAEIKNIGELSQLWLGYRTSIVRTDRGPMLQVDRAASCMLAPIDLKAFIAQKLKLPRGHGDLKFSDGRQPSGSGDGEPRLNGVPIRAINAKLTEGTRNLKVACTHRMTEGGKPTMEYVVRGLGTRRCDEEMFLEVCGACAQCRDPSTPQRGPASERCEAPREISVYQWFRREFPRVRIDRPDLPCILVGPLKEPRGGRPKIPLELCRILPGQPVQELGSEVLQEMIRFTAIEPRQRFPIIDGVVRNEFMSADVRGGHGGHGGRGGGGSYSGRGASGEGGSALSPRLSEGFGLTVSPQLQTTQGRVLEPCSLLYRNQTIKPQTEDCNHFQKGGWNLSRTQFQVSAKAPGWAICLCTPLDSDSNINMFANTLERVAMERDMKLGPAIMDPGRPGPIDANAAIQRGDLEGFLSAEVSRLEAMQRDGATVGILLCVMADSKGANGKYVYPALKRWSHTMSGIPVQCVQQKKALKVGEKRSGKMANDPQYAAGLLLKMNLKLGGENAYAVTPDRVGQANNGIALMQAMETMVVGLDVHHAAPGSQGASYAAVVASLDPRCVRYRTVVTEQAMIDSVDPRGGSTRKVRQEIVDTLEETMMTLLHDFATANSRPPRRIIFFRDGVAHNQFEAVTQEEVAKVRRACHAVCGHSMPQLVFIVTQMRTKARLAEWGRGKGGEGWQNVPPGTIVDRDITGAGVFDWYMVPHHALQGSARASHYHVLENDAHLTADELQRFSFDLCHLYGRATKIVSRPAHLYYAHLAAALGPYYSAGYKERDADEWDLHSTSSHSSNRSTSARQDLHPNVVRRVYYA